MDRHYEQFIERDDNYCPIDKTDTSILNRDNLSKTSEEIKQKFNQEELTKGAELLLANYSSAFRHHKNVVEMLLCEYLLRDPNWKVLNPQ